jgi:hypothetical protein
MNTISFTNSLLKVSLVKHHNPNPEKKPLLIIGVENEHLLNKTNKAKFGNEVFFNGCDKLIYTSIQIYKTPTLQRRLSSID